MIKKIGIKNVNFGFNRKVFFKNLSITFCTKGISVIIGPNGSGKSLITKLLKGIILPDSGEIQLVSDKITPKISYLSQKITFLRRDVYSNLAYPLVIRNYQKKQIRQKVNKILKNFNFFIESIKKEKPDTMKGELIKNIYLTSSMGISYKIGGKI